MRVLQRTDYEDLAKEAVDQMLDASVPLADSLVKISDSMGLAPDQIKALVQVANTLAHLDLFDRKADDKVVEFDPADPSDVVQRVVSSGPETIETPMSSEGRTTDFFSDLPRSDSSACDSCSTKKGCTKDASSCSSCEDKDHCSSCEDKDNCSSCEHNTTKSKGAKVVKEALDNLTPHRQQMGIIKVQKVAEELNQRKISAALEYEETLDKLASDFASLYGPSLEEFEKDAIDTYDSDALPVLGDLRKLLRMSDIKIASHEKTVRLVDTSTAEMKTFKKLCSLVEEAETCEAGLQLLKQEAGDLL